MTLYLRLIYVIFIYLISNNKWVIVESTDTSATPPASSGGDGTSGTPGQGASTTPTADRSTDTGTKTGVELSIKATAATDQFNYSKDGQVVKYTAKDKYYFKSVKTGKKDDIVVWSTTNDNEYAMKIEVEGDNKVTIHIGDGTSASTKVFNKSSDGKWKEATLSQAGSSAPGTSTSPGSSSSTASQAGTSQGSQSTSPDVLNITSQQGTNDFDYKKDGNYVTFTAKGCNVFKTVKDDKIEVWKASDATNVSEKVEVDNLFADAKVITIYLPNDKTKVFVKDSHSDSYTEVDLTKVRPVLVYIDYKQNCFFYEVAKVGDTCTFTSKTGYIFKGVSDYINDSIKHRVIWSTSNVNEYSKKVVLEKDKKLTIHIGEGTSASTNVIEKGSDGIWPRPCLDLDLKSDTKSNDNFEYNKLGKNVTYTAKEGKAFKRVKVENTDIWSADKESDYSEKVVVEGDDKVTIHIGLGINAPKKVFKKGTDNKWKEDTSLTQTGQSGSGDSSGESVPKAH